MSLGPAEILVIFVVALLVFGPTRLPEVGRQVGRGMREIRKFQQTLKGDLDDVLGDDSSPASTTPAEPADSEPAPTLPPKELAETGPDATSPDATSPTAATRSDASTDTTSEVTPHAPVEGAATSEPPPTPGPA